MFRFFKKLDSKGIFPVENKIKFIIPKIITPPKNKTNAHFVFKKISLFLDIVSILFCILIIRFYFF